MPRPGPRVAPFLRFLPSYVSPSSAPSAFLPPRLRASARHSPVSHIPAFPIFRFSPSAFRLPPFLLLFLSAASSSAASPAAGAFPSPRNSGDPIHHAAPPVAGPAAARLQLPPGFHATLFAAEPDVQNPVAMAWDTRGRLWVAENYTYAERGVAFDRALRDRVVVFEDRGSDGRFSRRQVFLDTIQRLTSVEVGHGGVWLMCPPQLLFVPDRDGDAVPDGPPEVVLDGFAPAQANHHNFANGLRFGPDGWLYGRCGASNPGELGLPGTPETGRIPLRGTFWRFHPTRKTVEVLSTGTTNPWGHDWDAHGELFFINTVNGHLWHGIVGAHYRRAHTLDPNPAVFELIDQHADHWHFDTSRTWQASRDGAANALGGGHAHVGMMIYQGENWPAPYRDSLFTLNFHGRRANRETLARHGSGYVGRHAPDFFVSPDPWFRGIDLDYGPDGGVFVLDWSDTGECHNATGVNRTSGRIFKIVYGEPTRPPEADLPRRSPRELAALQAHRNEWLVRQARRELAARHLAGQPLADALTELHALLAPERAVTVRLRALWTLFALDAAPSDLLRPLLREADEHLRTWAVRLLTDRWPLDTVMSRRPDRPDVADPATVDALVALARTEPSGLVRLALTSTLQRLPVSQRAALSAALGARGEDAADHNLPLLHWYGLIPLAETAPLELARLAAASELPATRRLATRRLALDLAKSPEAIDTVLRAAAGSAAFRQDVLAGLAEALKGWRRAPKPPAWETFVAALGTSAEAALLDRVRELQVVFGDGRALSELKALALDARAELGPRQAALQALIEARPPDLRDICERLLRVRFLNPIAVRGLVLFDDPTLAELIASAYTTFFHPSERGAAIDALVSRPAFARVLLQRVAEGKIPRDAISAFHARQIRAFDDPDLHRALATAWGEFREAAGDARATIARLKSELTPAVLAQADKRSGRALYQQLCSACHRLYGEGAALGPDLTGAGRGNLDYLLENLVDPGAVVTADYRLSVVKMKDGRVLSGFLPERTARTVTVRSATETQVVERTDIASTETLPQSLMPAGLLEALPPSHRADLLAYLMHTAQVPLPEN